MDNDPSRRRVDPRSPVQPPPPSPVPYLLAAAVAAILAWTLGQEWMQDRKHATGPSQPNGSGSVVVRDPSELRSIFSADDYPADAMRNGEQGTVKAELSIDEQGLVQRCKVIQSSGHSSLDQATCGIIKRRARFRPARDAAGNPVASTVTTPQVHWVLAD